jgi:hypothetical protein
VGGEKYIIKVRKIFFESKLKTNTVKYDSYDETTEMYVDYNTIRI